MKLIENYKLKKGDAVAIVSPASHLTQGSEVYLEKGVDILTQWGLRVKNISDLSKRHFYLAGNDTERASELITAMNDPEIRAVFCMRGGYGSARLISLLENQTFKDEKLFCGFSDITTLLCSFLKLAPNIINVHAPNIATEQFTANSKEAEQNQARLKEVLFNPDKALVEKVEVIKQGKSEGVIVGGCLSVLVSLMGTDYEPAFDNSIVFFEDVNERPYKIDRMLTQLILAGAFDKVKGVIFGEMVGCDEPAIDLKKVIIDLFSGFDFPIVFGQRSGHGKVNLAFHLGQIALIDSYSSQITIR